MQHATIVYSSPKMLLARFRSPRTTGVDHQRCHACRYLNLLRDAFNGSGSGRGLHFSFDANITQTQQRAARLAADAGAAAKPLYASAEPRFFWNQKLLQPVIGALQDVGTLLPAKLLPVSHGTLQ